MQRKEILSSRNSKQAKPQSFPEISTAKSRLVRAWCGQREVFKRRYVLTIFAYLLLRCTDVHSHSSAPESNKQNPRDSAVQWSAHRNIVEIFLWQCCTGIGCIGLARAPNSSDFDWVRWQSKDAYVPMECPGRKISNK